MPEIVPENVKTDMKYQTRNQYHWKSDFNADEVNTDRKIIS
jgi:hypothetical protein